MDDMNEETKSNNEALQTKIGKGRDKICKGGTGFDFEGERMMKKKLSFSLLKCVREQIHYYFK